MDQREELRNKQTAELQRDDEKMKLVRVCGCVCLCLCVHVRM